jgi:hypothetical protein
MPRASVLGEATFTFVEVVSALALEISERGVVQLQNNNNSNADVRNMFIAFGFTFWTLHPKKFHVEPNLI